MAEERSRELTFFDALLSHQVDKLLMTNVYSLLCAEANNVWENNSKTRSKHRFIITHKCVLTFLTSSCWHDWKLLVSFDSLDLFRKYRYRCLVTSGLAQIFIFDLKLDLSRNRVLVWSIHARCSRYPCPWKLLNGHVRCKCIFLTSQTNKSNSVCTWSSGLDFLYSIWLLLSDYSIDVLTSSVSSSSSSSVSNGVFQEVVLSPKGSLVPFSLLEALTKCGRSGNQPTGRL